MVMGLPAFLGLPVRPASAWLLGFLYLVLDELHWQAAPLFLIERCLFSLIIFDYVLGVLNCVCSSVDWVCHFFVVKVQLRRSESEVFFFFRL